MRSARTNSARTTEPCDRARQPTCSRPCVGSGRARARVFARQPVLCALGARARFDDRDALGNALAHQWRAVLDLHTRTVAWKLSIRRSSSASRCLGPPRRRHGRVRARRRGHTPREGDRCAARRAAVETGVRRGEAQATVQGPVALLGLSRRGLVRAPGATWRERRHPGRSRARGRAFTVCHSHSYSALAPFLDPVATRTGCRALLADCEFDGGHMTTCVTAKSSTGGRLLGEIAPRRPHPPDGVQRSGRSRQPRVGRGDRRPGPGGPRAVVGVLTLLPLLPFRQASEMEKEAAVTEERGRKRREGERGGGERGEREKEREKEEETEERGRKRGRKRRRRKRSQHTHQHTQHTTPTQHTQHTQHQNTQHTQPTQHNKTAELQLGIEPRTNSLRGWCSAAELLKQRSLQQSPLNIYHTPKRRAFPAPDASA